MSKTNTPSTQQHVELIAQWILESEHLVAFTGAGIGTDSGIPDFRGPDGVWTRRDAGLPAPRWKVRPDQVCPNASHLALAELQQLGKLRFLFHAEHRLPAPPVRDQPGPAGGAARQRKPHAL